MAAAIDITNLGAVKTRAEVVGTNDDDEIQAAITSFSRYLNLRLGSSFTGTVDVVETRDGNGNSRMFVRTPPINTVAAVVINGVGIKQAGPFPSFGYYVADDKRSIIVRASFAGTSRGSYSPGYRRATASRGAFVNGIGNVMLSYNGGVDKPPEDLEYAARCVIALNYKRKATQDMASKSTSIQGGSATTRYRDWRWPPEFEEIFSFYQRTVVVE